MTNEQIEVLMAISRNALSIFSEYAKHLMHEAEVVERDLLSATDLNHRMLITSKLHTLEEKLRGVRDVAQSFHSGITTLLNDGGRYL